MNSKIKKAFFFFVVLSLIGCANGVKARKARISYDNINAQNMYQRAQTEVKHNEFAPAINDILYAEQICNNDDLMRRITNFKRDLFNHIQVNTTIEKHGILKYTMLYKKEKVFYPIDNMNINFKFVEGEGILTESVTTNTNGTATGKIEKITSIKRKIVVEAAPVFHFEEKEQQIGELKRTFVFSRRSASTEEDTIKGVIVDSVSASLDFIDGLINDIFGSEE